MRKIVPAPVTFAVCSLLILSILIASYFRLDKSSYMHEVEGKSYNIFCYYESYASSRAGPAKVSPEDLDPFLCTHIAYSFFGVNDNATIRILAPRNDIKRQGIRRFVALKTKNPRLKLLATVGGWSGGSSTFSKIVSSSTLREAFVKNSIQFMKQHGFDGMDIDWEYPGLREGRPSDRFQFVKLLQELHVQCKNEGLILTVAVAPLSGFRKTSYDIPKISRYVDYINLMSYNYHTYKDKVTGQNSPLYASEFDSNDEKNVNASVQMWIKFGADPRKINLGTAFYGRTFTLSNTKHDKLGSKVKGPGFAGPYLKARGVFSYLEACSLLQNGEWTIIFDYQQGNPYAFRKTQWLGCDNERSLILKAQYAIDNDLGGIMIWAVDQDDVFTHCANGKFPLLKSINSIFNRNSLLGKL